MRSDIAANLIEALPLPVAILEPDATVVRMNARARQVLGDTEAGDSLMPSILGSGFDDQAIARALQDGHGEDTAWHVADLGSSLRLLTVRLPSSVTIQLERLKRLQTVFDGLNEGVLFLDPFGRVTLTNNFMIQSMAAYGITIEVGQPYQRVVRQRLDFEDRIPVPERDAAAEKVVQLLLDRCRTGANSTLELADRIIAIEHKMVDDHYLQVYRDVTEREQQAKELRISAERYRRVIEDQSEMISRFDPDLTLTFTNTAYRKAFSPDGSDIVGRPFLELIPNPAAQKALEDGIKALTPDDPILSDTYMEPDQNGNPRWMTWVNRAIFDKTGVLIEYQAIGRDVTAERLAQEALDRQNEALAQSEKMAAMGSLLASVSHELNNPLSVVLGQSELLESLTEDDSTRERAQRIKAAADRCARIVRTFLAMARQREPELKPIDLALTVESARSMAAYAFSSSGIELNVDLPNDEMHVSADGDQLVQLVVNILLNAQQALEEQPPPRSVSITGEVDEDWVRLEISDNGPGVPSDLRDKVFEPFFTTKEEGSGTGIGLALCRSIAENHGGTFSLDKSGASGARFQLVLPHNPLANDETTVGEVAQKWKSLPPLRVLVVDDEVEVGRNVRDFLRHDGHSVEVVHDGREALDRIEAEEFDLILSDIRMPGLDGPGLWKALKETGAFPLSRIGFLTGDTLGAVAKRFLDGNEVEVVVKPFLQNELRALILRLLEAEV